GGFARDVCRRVRDRSAEVHAGWGSDQGVAPMIMSNRSLTLAAICVALSVGCGSGQIDGPAPTTKTVSKELEPLTLHDIQWNAAKTDVGLVSAIVEDDEELVLFGAKGATMMAGGAVRGVIPGAASWTAAAT